MSNNQKRGKCSHSMAATDPPHAVRALQDLRRCYRQALQRMLRPDDGAATSGRQGTCIAASPFGAAQRTRYQCWLVFESAQFRWVGSPTHPGILCLRTGGGAEGAGAPLQVVVAVRTGPLDSTAVMQTEPRTDSVAIVPLCKQGADKRPLDPSRKRVREQEGPDPSRKRACEQAVDRVARKCSKGNAATLDPRNGLRVNRQPWTPAPAGVRTGCPGPLTTAGERTGGCPGPPATAGEITGWRRG